MPTTAPFERYTDRYESWFDDNPAAYRSERAALERLVPGDAESVEIGVGTGRFAAPLDVEVGVDPAGEMLDRAVERGVDAVRGVAETLPLATDRFDAALVVTTVCFLDDLSAALAEARRVLRPGGSLVVGLLDPESPVGRHYEAGKDESPFYRDAAFVSTAELLDELEAAGFGDVETVQTIFESPAGLEEPEPVREGYGDGLFVGVRADAPE